MSRNLSAVESSQHKQSLETEAAAPATAEVKVVNVKRARLRPRIRQYADFVDDLVNGETEHNHLQSEEN